MLPMTKNITCFLIDDDGDDREIFTIAAEANGASVVTAENGVDALEKLHSDSTFTPDCIFLDLNMPYLSGIDCLSQIKKIDRLDAVPVIVYTTSSYEKDVEKTRQLNANHFLVKPTSLNVLIDRLSNIFSQQDLPFYLDQ